MSKFLLQASRQILETAPRAINIDIQIQAIEAAIEQTPTLVFDLSKSLIDTVCKTILADRGVKLPGTPNSPKLLKETLKILDLHPVGIDHVPDTKKSLKNTVNGLLTAMGGISNLRNKQGLIGHGRDGYAPSLENIQAQFVAGAADAIVHILYQSHKGYGGKEANVRIIYEDYKKENDRIDESFDEYSMIEFVNQFLPSEILFKMDKEEYRNAINDVRNEETE